MGGARLVQYRDKTATNAARRRQATALLGLCNRHQVPLVINDDVALARAAGARGVHLGRDDMSIRDARALLGEDAIIGASCYNDFARAERACKEGADYITFGSFFGSPTKPHAVTADLDLIRRARRHLRIPVCAIGGITIDNAPSLLEVGADLLAVVSGLFAQPEPRLVARAFAALFDRETDG